MQVNPSSSFSPFVLLPLFVFPLSRCMVWSGWLTWGVRWTALTCWLCWPLQSATTSTTRDTTMPIRYTKHTFQASLVLKLRPALWFVVPVGVRALPAYISQYENRILIQPEKLARCDFCTHLLTRWCKTVIWQQFSACNGWHLLLSYNNETPLRLGESLFETLWEPVHVILCSFIA